MKRLLQITLIAFLSLIIFETQAQKAGFKIGLNMANATLKDADSTVSSDDKKILFAPRIGFTFEIPIQENLFIQTGIATTISGFRFKNERAKGDIINGTFEIVETKDMFVLWYLELPVNLGVKFELDKNIHFIGMAGPVFRYMLYSTIAYKMDGEWDNEPTNVDNGSEKIKFFSNFDIGLNIEAGIQVDRFQFTLYYNPCFSNVWNEDFTGDSDVKWKNYNFGINIGIQFGQVDKGRRGGYRRR